MKTIGRDGNVLTSDDLRRSSKQRNDDQSGQCRALKNDGEHQCTAADAALESTLLRITINEAAAQSAGIIPGNTRRFDGHYTPPSKMLRAWFEDLAAPNSADCLAEPGAALAGM
jgi:hypothetical protein